ncbi:MAG: unnamed protein product [uncultured Paraburkholderia sp.]|nr:MAG: unnamed protein product [uncultured Paraburkholderia sp.]
MRFDGKDFVREGGEMIRARFYVNADDPRPVNWPIKHPYWVSGYVYSAYGIKTAGIIVAYADDVDAIMRNWPDAHDFSFINEVTEYTFTDRFAKPDGLEDVQ